MTCVCWQYNFVLAEASNINILAYAMEAEPLSDVK